MTSCYLDTSFLIKLYVFEDHSKEAARLIKVSRVGWVTNRLSDLEVASALRRKSMDGFLTASEAQMAIGKYRGHQTAGLYQQKSVNEAVFLLAEALIERHGDFIRLRSLDLLHVATALHYGIDGFATFDADLKVLAERAGLELLC